MTGCSGGGPKTATRTGEEAAKPNPSRPDVGPGASGDTAPKAGDAAEAKVPALPKPNPEAFSIPAKGNGGWVSTRVDARDLAKNISKALSSLKGIEGETVTTLTTPGGHGQVRGKLKIQNERAYSIQFPVVQMMPAMKEARSNGKVKAVSTDQGVFPRKSRIDASLLAGNVRSGKLAENWARYFPQLVFSSLTDGKDVWQPLFAELADGHSGFKAEISQRTLDFRERKVSNFRLTAKRNPEAAKRFGPCEMEMVFDGERFLPVTIRMNFKDPKEGEYKVLWQTAWNFDRKFDPKDFAL